MNSVSEVEKINKLAKSLKDTGIAANYEDAVRMAEGIIIRSKPKADDLKTEAPADTTVVKHEVSELESENHDSLAHEHPDYVEAEPKIETYSEEPAPAEPAAQTPSAEPEVVQTELPAAEPEVVEERAEAIPTLEDLPPVKPVSKEPIMTPNAPDEPVKIQTDPVPTEQTSSVDTVSPNISSSATAIPVNEQLAQPEASVEDSTPSAQPEDILNDERPLNEVMGTTEPEVGESETVEETPVVEEELTEPTEAVTPSELNPQTQEETPVEKPTSPTSVEEEPAPVEKAPEPAQKRPGLSEEQKKMADLSSVFNFGK